MNRPFIRHAYRLVLCFLLVPGVAMAQAELVPEKKLKEVKKSEGWAFLLTPGANASLSDNRSVIGQPDGLTMTLGITLASGADLRRGAHEFRNQLKITELFTHTPILEEFVKSTDIFKLESVYLYHLLKWVGPFAKLNLDSAMLESFDARPEPVIWSIAHLDGSSENRTGLHLRLTDGFSPLTLKETGGAFMKPYEDEKLNLEVRLGFGGMHVFADEQLALKDDGGTPEIEVIELKSFSQAGGVLEAGLWGKLYQGDVLYRIGVEVMMPFVNDLEEGDDRGVVDLTNIEISASLTFKVLSWMSIDYVFKAIRQPQLLDEFQVQNNLLLTASYTFFKPPKEEKK